MRPSSLICNCTSSHARRQTGVLATVYGSIAEEVLLCLDPQTVLAVGIRRLRKERTIPPSASTRWAAIALSILL